jgi:hypothetical protein
MNQTQGNVVWHPISVNNGWNLLSLPAIPSGSINRNLFPDVSAQQFYYFENGVYLQPDSLEFGRGYWFYDSVSATRFIPGIPVSSRSYQLSVGWNLIGSISYDVPLSNVFDPEHIVNKDSWSHFDGSGYVSSDTLKKGSAYWVYAERDGTISLSIE